MVYYKTKIKHMLNIIDVINYMIDLLNDKPDKVHRTLESYSIRLSSLS